MFKGTVHLEIRNTSSLRSCVWCTLSVQTVKVFVYECWRYRLQRWLPSLQHNETKKYVKEKLNSSVSIHQSWFKIIHRPCWEQLHVRTVDQRLALADIKHLSNYWHQWFFCHIVDKIWVKSSAVVQLPLTQHCLTGHTAKQLVSTCIQWM